MYMSVQQFRRSLSPSSRWFGCGRTASRRLRSQKKKEKVLRLTDVSRVRAGVPRISLFDAAWPSAFAFSGAFVVIKEACLLASRVEVDLVFVDFLLKDMHEAPRNMVERNLKGKWPV